MKQLSAATHVICFGIAVLVHANSAVADSHNRTPLSEYSTDEIVDEYLARRSDAEAQILAFNEVLAGGQLISELSPEERVQYRSQLNNIVEKLTPFLKTEDTGTMAYVGNVMLDGLELIEPDPCLALNLLFNAAIADGGLGSSGLSQYYYFKAVLADDPNAERLAILWAMESAHRDPIMQFSVDILTQDMTEEAEMEIKEEWADWSPRTDMDIQEEIDRYCVS